MLTSTIDFYEINRAAVTIDWQTKKSGAAPAESKRFMETVLFACFLLRQYRNLNLDPVSKAISRAISQWQLPIFDQKDDAIVALSNQVLLDAAYSLGMDSRVANDKYGNPLYLVRRHGSAKKRFIGELQSRGNKTIFQLHPKGFGLSGKDINQYASNSVIIFLTYLALSHSNDSTYPEKLKKIGIECGNAFFSNQVDLTNQEMIASMITKNNLG
jgi:hypothetical protein